MWPFRRSQSPPDGPRPDQTPLRTHDSVLDLIEQVAAIRGQIRNLEVEWESVRAQIRKDYQRVEKANERAERRTTMDGDEEPVTAQGTEEDPPLHGFAAKLQAMKGG